MFKARYFKYSGILFLSLSPCIGPSCLGSDEGGGQNVNNKIHNLPSPPSLSTHLLVTYNGEICSNPPPAPHSSHLNITWELETAPAPSEAGHSFRLVISAGLRCLSRVPKKVRMWGSVTFCVIQSHLVCITRTLFQGTEIHRGWIIWMNHISFWISIDTVTENLK